MYRVQIPSSDIDACIKFSWTRCVFSLLSLLLVSSDIPRTGYGVRSITSLYEPVAPSTAINFGPYAYAVAQIQKTSNATSVGYQGTCESEEITSTRVWSYKFDSLSIPLRATARLASFFEYPRCLQYFEECPSKFLSLEMTFKMLDGLVSAFYRGYLSHQQHEIESASFPPLVFYSRSYWIDRLVHVLLDKFTSWRRVDKRSYAVHYYQGNRGRGKINASLSLCNHLDLHQARHPYFCDQFVAWTVDVTSSTSTTSKIKISDHISQRLSALEQQHPDLTFDLTVFTTRFPTLNTNFLPFIPTVYYRTRTIEVTTLIRGRTCSSNPTSEVVCVTLLVDDYRYEAAILETNAEDWYKITSSIRWLAQVYVWMRLLLLWFGCYFARSSEPKFVSSTLLRRIFLTWVTIFKIPGHVIVYGSWPPIILYALAHYMDSGFVHTVCENVLSSLNGAIQLDFLTYVKMASIQMRNIWYIALVVKCAAAMQIHLLTQRWSPWTLRDGFIGLRGGLIGFVSSLTIFAYLRYVQFRNTNIVSVTQLSFESLRVQREFSQSSVGSSEFGFPFDLRMVFAVIAGVACVVLLLKVYLVCGKSEFHRSLQRHFIIDAEAMTHVSFSRQHYVPYSAGTLAPLSVLSLFWKISIQKPVSSPISAQSLRHHHRFTSISSVTRNRKVSAAELIVAPSRSSPDPTNTNATSQLVYSRGQQPNRLKLPTKGVKKTKQQAFLRVDKRTKELWSVIKLMHIAHLTEPLALLGLCFVGQELYLYRHTRRDRAARQNSPSDMGDLSSPKELFLLPCDHTTLSRNMSESEEGEGEIYELLGAVDSKTVPWRLLIYCG